MSTKTENGSNGRALSGSNGSSKEALDSERPLRDLDDLLLDEDEWFEEESRISVVIQQPPSVGSRSMIPLRAAKGILALLPPWGRVLVLIVGIVAALVAYRWEQISSLLGL
jgi:hypothetical protein